MKNNYDSIIIKSVKNLGEKIWKFKKLGCKNIGYYTIGDTTILKVTWNKHTPLKETN